MPSSPARAAALVIVAVTVWAGSAGAAVLHVPGDHATIQAAVDAAAVGDSVLVGPGIWTGENRNQQACTNLVTAHSVVFVKPGVSVIGTAGPASTILDGGPETSPAVATIFHFGDGLPALLEGFTITGEGSGVETGCSTSRLDLRNCIVAGNGRSGLVSQTANVTMTDCVFRENAGNLTSPTAAVTTILGGTFEAVGTRFEANRWGAILAQDLGRVAVDNCEFIDHPNGKAIGISGTPDVAVRNSLFLRNRIAGLGAAISLGQSIATIELNTFAYDSSLVTHAGAINIASGSSAQVRNNTFYRCFSAGLGSAIMVSLSAITVDANVVVECSGAAFARDASTVHVPASGCNVLWNNTENYFDWPAAASATDISADPEFCDTEALDFRVRASSPAATANSGDCGQIGAHGVGCGAVSIEPTTWGRIKEQFRAENGGK